MALVHVRPFDPQFVDESPWHWPLRGAFTAFAGHADFPSAAALSARYATLCAHDGARLPLVFAEVPKQKPRRRPKGPLALHTLYEGRIAERGEVPQRPGDWHDLFNALAFMVFPRAKAALHLRQYAIVRGLLAPTATRLPGARTREQDALALFDEGGVAVVTSPEDAQQIDVDGDDCGPSVLALCRAGRALVVPFGHALHEHLVAGLPLPLAMPHVVTVPGGWQECDDLLAQVDRALAESLGDSARFTRPARTKGLSLAALPCHAPG